MGDATEVCAVNTMYRTNDRETSNVHFPKGDMKQLEV